LGNPREPTGRSGLVGFHSFLTATVVGTSWAGVFVDGAEGMNGAAAGLRLTLGAELASPVTVGVARSISVTE